MNKEHIEERIFKIRGRQVMLDVDLAKLYCVPTHRLNEQVRRNISRFPPDFMFQLTAMEVLVAMRSQNASASKRNKRYRPFAFTELGVAMLSSVLRSPRAIQVNIAIMRAFVRLRHAVLSSRDVLRRVDKLEGKVDIHETDIRLLVEDVKNLKNRRRLDPPIGPTEVV